MAEAHAAKERDAEQYAKSAKEPKCGNQRDAKIPTILVRLKETIADGKWDQAKSLVELGLSLNSKHPELLRYAAQIEQHYRQ